MSADKKMTIEEAAEKGLLSADVAQEKREALKQLFPEVFTEDTIDFEQLRRVMGDWVEPGKERYGLNWPGKAECMKVIQAPSIATLKPARDESVNFDETENLFIEGDNLEVLKLLQKAYFGKVKMIYIDPPYNTGKEFIYPDKYQENLDTYLAYTGQVDDEGKKFATNTDAGGRYHSNWLNMMYPRLYLARNLLSEDGVIFISIDDNEVGNLRFLADHLFGETNFIGQFAWKSRVSEDTRAKTGISADHEYVICYRRDDGVALRGTPKDLDKFKNPDNDPRGAWRSADMTGLATKDRRPNLHYDLVNPTTGINYGCPPKGWRFDKSSMDKRIGENRVLWPASSDGRPRQKLYLDEMDSIYKNISSVIQDVSTSDGTREVNALLGDGIFDFPKPTALLVRLLEQASGEDGIILDFFAGSCATAHAVMKLNQKSGKTLKYIMVQLPEPCDDQSVAANAGYENIAEVGKQRIRLAADQIRTTDASELDINGSTERDLGFKSFKLTRSNFSIWDVEVEQIDDLTKQLELHVDHIDQESGPEDILYELLLKAGFELTTKVEKKEMAGKDVYAVSDGAMLICLDKEITPELIDALADANPLQVICLDEGFKGNDQLKTNAVQTFKSRAKEDEEPIVFRTV